LEENFNGILRTLFVEIAELKLRGMDIRIIARFVCGVNTWTKTQGIGERSAKE
jgi:hypothetical protein